MRVKNSALLSRGAQFESGQGSQLSREIFPSYLTFFKRALNCATATFSHVVANSRSTFDNRDQYFPTTVSQNIVRGSTINRGTNKILKYIDKPYISIHLNVVGIYFDVEANVIMV